MYVKTNSSALSQLVKAQSAFFRTGIFPRAQRFRHIVCRHLAHVSWTVSPRASLSKAVRRIGSCHFGDFFGFANYQKRSIPAVSPSSPGASLVFAERRGSHLI
jgi:hypothetical protein